MQDGRFERNDVSSVYGIQAEEDKKGILLFHYTSLDVMDKLLEQSTFRASNIFYLNDAAEYKAGIDRLFDVVCDEEAKKIIKEIEIEDGQGRMSCGVFSISFSQEKDSLHQWITYAKESGVAIELDSELINNIEDGVFWLGVDSYDFERDKECGEKQLLSASLKTIMKPVQYEYEEDYFVKENILPSKEVYMWLASYMKQPDFKTENEIRIAILASRTEEKQSKMQYYVMPSGGLRPFLNITFGMINLAEERFAPMLPLRSITVGPSGKQQVVFDSVVHRLKYGESKVYNYAENRKLLIHNFVMYLNEMISWLARKRIVENVLELEKIKTYKQGIYYIENFCFEENGSSTLERQIKEHAQSLWQEECLAKENDKKSHDMEVRDFVSGEEYENNEHCVQDENICERIKNKVSLSKVLEEVIRKWIKENEENLKKIIVNNERVYEDVDLLLESSPSINGEVASKISKIIYEFGQDVFFTKEGILIKKSKIPYIF